MEIDFLDLGQYEPVPEPEPEPTAHDLLDALADADNSTPAQS
jgi:hypothetical protein